MKTTIKDIVRETGLSVGTVSNVLNGRQTVSIENKEKVLAAVNKLNYSSNLVARSLKTKKSASIGLIIPSITNPYYPELARGVEDYAHKEGYTTFLCNADRDVIKEREYIKTLIANQVDSIILVKSRLSFAEIDAFCRQTTIVQVDRKMGEKQVGHCVSVDNEVGLVEGFDLLYEKGHRKIAFISGLVESISSEIRRESYLKYLKDKSIEIRDDYIMNGDWTWESGYRAAKKLFKLKDPPTAIFAANDVMAAGVVKAAHQTNKIIPYELSVLGFDDIEIAKICCPALTTVNQPKYEIGKKSLEIIKKCKKNTNQHNYNVMLSSKLVVRDSVTFAHIK